MTDHCQHRNISLRGVWDMRLFWCCTKSDCTVGKRLWILNSHMNVFHTSTECVCMPQCQHPIMWLHVYIQDLHACSALIAQMFHFVVLCAALTYYHMDTSFAINFSQQMSLNSFYIDWMVCTVTTDGQSHSTLSRPVWQTGKHSYKQKTLLWWNVLFLSSGILLMLYRKSALFNE